MKTLLSILFLVSVSAALATSEAAAAAAPVSDDILLSAISAVETGNNPAHLGRYGERTQLQILPSTWREFSRIPHSQAASYPAETERVARAFLAQIRNRLKERGLPQTPYYIAAAWNAGPSWRSLTRGTMSYAERVANVVEVMQARRAAYKATIAKAPQQAPEAVVEAAKVDVAQTVALAFAKPGIVTLALNAPAAVQPEIVPTEMTVEATVPVQPIPVIDLNAPPAQSSARGAMMIFAQANFPPALGFVSN